MLALYYAVDHCSETRRCCGLVYEEFGAIRPFGQRRRRRRHLDVDVAHCVMSTWMIVTFLSVKEKHW